MSGIPVKKPGYNTEVSSSVPVRETSITAHVVRSISVTMSTIEIDIICGILAEAAAIRSGMDAIVAQEFIDAVNSLK